MELNNKEKKIKQVLTDINFDVDTDFLWKEVRKELDNKKKKRRFFWILPSLGFLSLGITAIVFLFNSNYSIVSNTDLSLEENTTSFNVRSLDTQDNNIKESNTLNRIIKQQAGSNLLESNNKLFLDPKNKSNSSSPKLKETTKRSNSTSFVKNLKSDLTEYTSANKIFQGSNLNLVSGAEKQSAILEKTAIVENFRSLIDIAIVDKLKAEKIITDKEDLSFVLIEPKANKHRFFISTGLGTIKNISTEILDNEGIPNNFFDREKSLWGMNTAILFGKETAKRYKIFGGFEYAQLVTQYYNGERETLSQETQTTFESIDQNNNLTTTEGYVSSTTFVDKDLLWHRHHNMLNFQLGVAKDLLPRSRIIIEPEISLLQNIFSSHRGYYFDDQSTEIVRFERGENNPYRKNTGLNSQVGINLGYESPQWQFAIHTSWRNPLSNLTNATNNYQIKNSQLSIQARVNYLLNWEKN